MASGTTAKMQSWVENSIVPKLNKVTSNYWFSLVADAVLYIVPFSMVSAIPSLWAFARKFLTVLPDISPISTFSFGLIGLFVSFIIPYNCMVKEECKDRSLIAGFTGIGTFMLCMPITTTEDGGTVFTMARFGAGGMFTAMFVGLIVAAIYKGFSKKSFFSEDSLIPDFVKNWFDNIVAILISLLLGWAVTYLANVNVFTIVSILMSPLTAFAQTLPGVIFMTVLMDFFYFFGVSGWVFTPVTRTIQQAAMAENMAMVQAGQAATNINAYGFTRYTMIGGEGSTLPLAIMMMFSKSKKNKMLGKATLVPSLFNINEPLVFSTIVDNPYMLVPMVLQAIILPANAWIWMHFGWAGCHYAMFDMNNLPNAVSAFFMAGGNWGNAILVCVNLLLATLIWFPFFKAYDKHQAEVEAEMEADEASEAE